MKDLYKEKISFLEKNYQELTPEEYYYMMFPTGSFQTINKETKNDQANGLLQFSTGSEDYGLKTRIIFDDHAIIEKCAHAKGEFRYSDFVIVSGCSYIGKKDVTKTRVLYTQLSLISMMSEKESCEIYCYCFRNSRFRLQLQLT